jgi:hypothetical protein
MPAIFARDADQRLNPGGGLDHRTGLGKLGSACFRDHAGLGPRLFPACTARCRLRIAAPVKPKPASIISQVDGSGMAGAV